MKLDRRELLERAGRLASMATTEAKSEDLAVVQNAAGKGWIAARMAAAAVAECRGGVRPKGTDRLRKMIRELSRDPKVREIDLLLAAVFGELHLECSEEGSCNRSAVQHSIRRVAEKLIPAAWRACGWQPQPSSETAGFGSRRRSR
jgi:hypothetical protein